MKRSLFALFGLALILITFTRCDVWPPADEPRTTSLADTIVLNLNPLRKNYQLIHLEHNKRRPYVILAKINADAYTKDTCLLNSMTFTVQSIRKNINYYYIKNVSKSNSPTRNGFDINFEVDRIKNLTQEHISEVNELDSNIINCDFDNPCEFTVKFDKLKIHNDMLVDYHLENTKELKNFFKEYKVSELTIDETQRQNFCCGAICKTYFTF